MVCRVLKVDQLAQPSFSVFSQTVPNLYPHQCIEVTSLRGGLGWFVVLILVDHEPVKPLFSLSFLPNRSKPLATSVQYQDHWDWHPCVLASCVIVQEIQNLQRQTSFWIVGNDYARSANFSGRMDANHAVDSSFIRFSVVSLLFEAFEAPGYKKWQSFKCV